LIKAFEPDELETRIERLEALIERRNQTSELTMTGT
jgi:predicted component of type VI protein secretion system